MFDFGISELGVIGAVALVVLGPEKLPRVARTVGNLVGRAQRYMTEVKSEVNRQIELDELRKMKSTVETSLQDVQSSVASSLQQINQDFEQTWAEATAGLDGRPASASGTLQPTPSHRRLRKPQPSAVPLWYRRQRRVRRSALSNAGRAARARS